MAWAECIPNFSEGRDAALQDRLRRAMAARAELLDWHSDADHHRSVATLVGPLSDLERAVQAAAEIAVERIDLTRHRGTHPRIGAIDVVPLVPLDGAPQEACVTAAHSMAHQLWERLRVPVYLYGAAARAAARQRLEFVRRHGFERLAALTLSGELRPDIGGPRPHPTAGACCVGVRDFMVAFNVLLADRDARNAVRIARAVREAAGGLPGVKALGMYLQTAGVAQVSMNLTQLDETPPEAAYARVADEAARLGVRVLGSELVGLAPSRALDAASAIRAGLTGFHRDMVLENRLREIRRHGASASRAGAAPGR